MASNQVESYTHWTAEQANEWYAGQPWLCGPNFLPSTAVNSTDMWQAESFDLETIDRELGWAEEIGFIQPGSLGDYDTARLSRKKETGT